MLLREYLAIRKETELIELGKQIFSDFMPLIKMGKMHKLTKTYNGYIDGKKIPIYVTYPSSSNWCWYDPDEKRIKINFRHFWDFKDFMECYMHEVTHAINDFRGYNNKNNYDFGNESFYWTSGKIKLVDAINELLYHLWSKDERTAYQTSAIKPSFLNYWVEKLTDDIKTLHKKSKYEEHVWTFVMQKVMPYIPKRYTNNWVHFKNYFIKKSQYLLDDYIKKSTKNIKYFEQNPIDAPEENTESPLIQKAMINDRLTSLGKYIFNTLFDYSHIIDKDEYENWWVVEKTYAIKGKSFKVVAKKDSFHEEAYWSLPELANNKIDYYDIGFKDYYDVLDEDCPKGGLIKIGKWAVKILKDNGFDVSDYELESNKVKATKRGNSQEVKPQVQPQEVKKQEVFHIKASSGDFETTFDSKEDLWMKIKERFPQMKDNVINAIMNNPKNYIIR